jgi:predicted permease
MQWVREWIQTSGWRQAGRSLLRRPAYLVATILTLGIGTGITTGVFALVDTVLVKPLPFPDAERLVTIYESSPSAREKTSLVAPARLEDWRRSSISFAEMAGVYSENVTETSGSEPERLEARRVTPRFFQVYGMQPLAGRVFVDAEEVFNGPGAAVISEAYWTRRYHRDVSAIGQALLIGGRRFEIVGVMPQAFSSVAIDAWLPSQTHPNMLTLREARFLNGIGRIATNVTIEAASHELASIQSALATQFPKSDSGWSAEVRSLKESRVATARGGLTFVFAAVGALWLIAVTNVAGLTLVQVRRRSREIAVRTALGASRGRVTATLVREGLLVALSGAVIGILLARWLVALMPQVLTSTPRLNELAIDYRSVAFIIGSSLLAACAFSVIPALMATRSGLVGAMAADTRSVVAGNHRLQRLLVVGQVALSLLLVGSATLLVRSYYNLTNVETGFNPAGALTFHIAARWDENRVRIGQLQEQLISRLEQLPHVEAAGFANFLPATGATLRYQVSVEGLSGPNADGTMTVGSRMITRGYLPALGARLAIGEWCPPLKADFTAPRHAIVNQRFVDQYAQGQNLVGRTMRMVQGPTLPATIVGVVVDIAEDGHATSPIPYVYSCDSAGAWPDPNYVVRTADARAFLGDLRRTVGELDKSRAVFGVRSIDEVLNAALLQPRVDAAMLGSFAAAALTLAALGLYSLFMLVVSERAREMAVRLAIGAEPRQLVHLVLAGAGRLLAAGIAVGVGLTAAVDRLFRGLLFGVSSVDPLALGAAAVMLVLAALIAIAGPAWRAARMAPTEALRGE